MKHAFGAVAVVLVVLSGADQARAQTTISVLPAEPARWDVAGHTGWLGGNKSDVGAEWDDWFDAWQGGASAGYYVTPHLKTEIQASFAGHGRVQGNELVPIPGLPYPAYRVQEHLFDTSSVGAGVSYQFRENAWFHPYVGGGVDVIRERHRIEVPQQVFPGRDPGLSVASPGKAADTVSWDPRPFVSAGFKLYLSERAFMRSELRSSLSHRGAAYMAWSAGIGVDL